MSLLKTKIPMHKESPRLTGPSREAALQMDDEKTDQLETEPLRKLFESTNTGAQVRLQIFRPQTRHQVFENSLAKHKLMVLPWQVQRDDYD